MFGKKKKKDIELIGREDVLRSAKEAPSGRITRKVPELMTWYRSVLGNREYQQDALFVSGSRKLAANKKTRILAVVCDGMGGMADGGRASRKAIDMMVN